MTGLLERLKDGGNVIVAEGYMWELERRGFLQFGTYLPEVVLERPSALINLHEEFALAGSDVIEAFTYLGYREHFRRHGREDVVESVNREALRIARHVADQYGKLMAGNISNTPLYTTGDQTARQKILEMFKEQVLWAVEGGADYIIGETYSFCGEAEIALEAIHKYGNGLPAVITLTPGFPDTTADDVPIPEACVRLESLGADVVGLNCTRGPKHMLPLLREIKQVCKVPIAALPVPYRTTDEQMTFFSLTDPESGKNLYPENMDIKRCNRNDVRDFARAAKEIGIQYVGLCCGNAPFLTREVAMEYRRNPPAAKYASDPSRSAIFGEDGQKQYGEAMLNVKRYLLGK